MHDIGKIGVTEAILLKSGRLDDGEMAVMRPHVEKGLEILQRVMTNLVGGDLALAGEGGGLLDPVCVAALERIVAEFRDQP